jgi:hypothetical protein
VQLLHCDNGVQVQILGKPKCLLGVRWPFGCWVPRVGAAVTTAVAARAELKIDRDRVALTATVATAVGLAGGTLASQWLGVENARHWERPYAPGRYQYAPLG